jgi:hypothetical protein
VWDVVRIDQRRQAARLVDAHSDAG